MKNAIKIHPKTIKSPSYNIEVQMTIQNRYTKWNKACEVHKMVSQLNMSTLRYEEKFLRSTIIVKHLQAGLNKIKLRFPGKQVSK